jgi:hypothetical protein
MDEAQKRIHELQSAVNAKEDISVISMLEADVVKLGSQIDELQADLKEARRDIGEKDAELELLRSYKDYVELMEGTDDEQCTNEILSATVDFSDIFGGKRVVVVGGYPDWRDKLEEVFKQQRIVYTFIDTELNKQLPKVKETDFVLLNIRGVSHGFFWKIVKKMEGSPTLVRVSTNDVKMTLHELTQRTSFSVASVS